MTYLLDTNTCVAHLRGKSPHVTQKVYSCLPNEVVVRSIVKGELVYGALHGTRSE